MFDNANNKLLERSMPRSWTDCRAQRIRNIWKLLRMPNVGIFCLKIQPNPASIVRVYSKQGGYSSGTAKLIERLAKHVAAAVF